MPNIPWKNDIKKSIFVAKLKLRNLL